MIKLIFFSFLSITSFIVQADSTDIFKKTFGSFGQLNLTANMCETNTSFVLSEQCFSNDCKAYVSGDATQCFSNDCKAYVSGDATQCFSKDCKAYVSGDATQCFSNDCKAYVSGDATQCFSKDCRAYNSSKTARPAFKIKVKLKVRLRNLMFIVGYRSIFR